MAFLLVICKMLFFIGISGLASFVTINRSLERDQNKTKFFLYSFGIGPALSTLILYYLLLLLPGFSSTFYLGIIMLTYVIMIGLNSKFITDFFDIGKAILKSILQIFHFKRGLKHYFFNTNIIFLGTILIVSAFGIKNILLTQLPGHDVFEYMIQGKYLFDDKAIEYVNHRYYLDSGFYYVGLHGWSFPLQVTLEKMVDDVTSYFGFDLYFKSLTLFYGILLLTTIYYWVKSKMEVLFAASIVLILCMAKAYLTSISYFHIDSYRMFFFSLAFLFTLEQVHKPNLKLLPLFAFVTGISAFTHSLGVIISVILGACLLFFLQKEWLYKIKFLGGFVALVMVFGGIHYILDIVFGTGWIFNEIDFY